jgi:hypothetical protein
MKVELYLEDPMRGGCGCSSSMKDRIALMNRIREEAGIWEKVKKQNNGAYERQVLSKIPKAKYSPHLKDAVESETSLPYVFVDERLVHSGSYPSLEQFKGLVGGA